MQIFLNLFSSPSPSVNKKKENTHWLSRWVQQLLVSFYGSPPPKASAKSSSSLPTRLQEDTARIQRLQTALDNHHRTLQGWEQKQHLLTLGKTRELNAYEEDLLAMSETSQRLPLSPEEKTEICHRFSQILGETKPLADKSEAVQGQWQRIQMIAQTALNGLQSPTAVH